MRKSVVRVCGVALLLAGSVSFGVTACGGDDAPGGTGDLDATAPDSGRDAPADGRIDGTIPNGDATPGTDSAIDGTTGDSTTPDSATPDAPIGVDAGRDADATTPPVDAAPDVRDAGPDVVEAGPDARALVAAFPNQITTALINQRARCCSEMDAGPTDVPRWVNLLETNSLYTFESHLVFISHAAESGNVAWNQAKADQCLAEIAAFTCDVGGVPAATYNAARSDCWAAMNGTLAVGSTCASSYECAPGNYCATPAGGSPDAGTPGTCQPLLGAGGVCTSLFEYRDPLACSYQQNGLERANYCADAGAGNPKTCQPQVGLGDPCTKDRNCSSGVCNGATCLSTYAAVPRAVCDAFRADAGP